MKNIEEYISIATSFNSGKDIIKASIDDLDLGLFIYTALNEEIEFPGINIDDVSELQIKDNILHNTAIILAGKLAQSISFKSNTVSNAFECKINFIDTGEVDLNEWELHIYNLRQEAKQMMYQKKLEQFNVLGVCIGAMLLDATKCYNQVSHRYDELRKSKFKSGTYLLQFMLLEIIKKSA